MLDELKHHLGAYSVLITGLVIFVTLARSYGTEGIDTGVRSILLYLGYYYACKG